MFYLKYVFSLYSAQHSHIIKDTLVDNGCFRQHHMRIMQDLYFTLCDVDEIISITYLQYWRITADRPYSVFYIVILFVFSGL